ncbi:MAG: glycosyltransferase [Acidobacteria bacterium]|nr:glycosyltransferase [Acidobacteriota bacterium]
MSKNSTKRSLLALTYWSYKDALVQSAVLPYLRMMRRSLPAGSEIFLLTAEQPHLRMSGAERRRAEESLAAEGVRLLTVDYTRFGARAAARLAGLVPRLLRLCITERVRHLHAWGPTAGGVGYFLSRLTGLPLVLDTYEPHAESMVEVGWWTRESKAFKLMFRLEGLQSRRARAAIATTRGVRDYAREKYGAEFERFYVKPATVDLERFSPERARDPELARQLGLEGKLVCVYAGKVGGIYLERELFDFFKIASGHWGERFRVLMLTDAPPERVRELAAASGLGPEVVTSKFVEFQDVPRHLALGDFAVNPVRPVPTKRYCTSVKDGEYWAMGLPVVITPDIGDDSRIIRENRIGAVVEAFTPEAYARAVKEIDALLNETPRAELRARIRAVADRERNVTNAERIYRELYAENA